MEPNSVKGITIFLTGLLNLCVTEEEVRQGEKKEYLKVGIPSYAGDHYLSMIIMGMPDEDFPISIPCPLSTDVIRIEVDNPVKDGITMYDGPDDQNWRDHLLVLDKEPFHEKDLGVRSGRIATVLRLTDCELYAAKNRCRRIVPPGGESENRTIASVIGARTGLNANSEVRLIYDIWGQENRLILKKAKDKPGDLTIYIGNLPPFSTHHHGGSHFQRYYAAFANVPRNRWFDVQPPTESEQQPDDCLDDPLVSRANPCDPIFLSQSPF